MAQASPRLIVYGDVHGCLAEWQALRELAAPRPGDLEVCVGDLVDRGPDPPGCLRWARELGISVVLGNHEYKYVRYFRQWLLWKANNKRIERELPPEKLAFFKRLSLDDLEWLGGLPFFARFGKVIVFHGGLYSSMTLTDPHGKGDVERLLWIRFLNDQGKPVSLNSPAGVTWWAEAYDGREGFAVYGHNPFPEPRRDAHALGIDTGCVFGGKLTAAVFPPAADPGEWDPGRVELVSIPARQKYADLMIED